jgi:glycogen debranching enzyme
MTSPFESRPPAAQIGTPEHFLIEQGELAAVANIQDALVIKSGDLFLFTDREGEIPADQPGGHGLYFHDARYLSRYQLLLQNQRPITLLSTAELGYSTEQEMTNPMFYGELGRPVLKQTIGIRRERVIDDVVQERLSFTNFNVFPVNITIGLAMGADFADIFEVRGMKRDRRGTLLDPLIEKDSITFGYMGLDGIKRQTRVTFSPEPTTITPEGAVYQLRLRHRESCTIHITIGVDEAQAKGPWIATFDRQRQLQQAWLQRCTQVASNNEFFNTMISRSLNDLHLLLSGNNEEPYVAAGIPWFATLFGRDALIASLQALPFNPDIARDTLRLLAQWQGKKVDSWRDEEPGKILHELRLGEMAHLKEVPFTPYYGSIDATPLFLLLAAQWYAWTGDLDFIRSLEPNLRAALEWVARYGDVDGDGYIEYEKHSSRGLVNQGWKDSTESTIYPDGTLVYPPIALVEVQGYVYAAKEGLSRVFADLGDEGLAQQLRQEAVELKEHFNQDFWLQQEGFYALALDGFKKPVATITSNPGHALWTGIITEERARAVVDRLLRNDMFSGWGIRTLSSRAKRYNPMGYHLGTVWPHDNSLIAMGCKRYGFEDELNEIATGLYDACLSFDYYRLPELFCGMARTRHNVPVRYPIACSPQAWAAGSMLLTLQAILGLEPNAPAAELIIARPALPTWLDSVHLRHMRVGNSRVDLTIHRRNGKTETDITDIEGSLKVSVVR